MLPLVNSVGKMYQVSLKAKLKKPSENEKGSYSLIRNNRTVNDRLINGELRAVFDVHFSADSYCKHFKFSDKINWMQARFLSQYAHLFQFE